MTRHAKYTTEHRDRHEDVGRRFSGRIYGNPTESLKQRADLEDYEENIGNGANWNPARPETDIPKRISDSESGNIGTRKATAQGTDDADRTRPVDIDPREPHHPEAYTTEVAGPHYTPPFDPQTKKARK